MDYHEKLKDMEYLSEAREQMLQAEMALDEVVVYLALINSDFKATICSVRNTANDLARSSKLIQETLKVMNENLDEY